MEERTYEVRNEGLASHAVRMTAMMFLLSAVPAMMSFAAVVQTIRPLSQNDHP